MAVKISGVLKDGTGKPVQNCTIQLKAKRNSTTVVVNTLASENPDEAGRYSMDVEYGQYSVILMVEGFPPSHAGTITVYEDSRPGTLNDFLGAMTEDDARPEALRRFELMVEEVARNASVVAQNTAAAKKSASDASTSAREAATHATDAAGSARAASTSSGQAASSASSAASSASSASASKDEATRQASAAKGSATTASTKATEAAGSATAAAQSKSTAESAATRAETAAKRAEDIASAVALEDASTTKKGIVQLSSATNSTSESLAATPKAVKAAYDNAEKRLQKDQNGADIPDKGRFLNNINVYSKSEVQSALAGKQPLDNTLTNLSGKDVAGLLTYLGLGEGSALPVGVPVPWPSATPPTGWLKCNGAAFDKVKYPRLATAYPSGKLPDLRGEFIRGWDDGRGIDTGRALLSIQRDEVRKLELKYWGPASNSSPSKTFAISNSAGGGLYTDGISQSGGGVFNAFKIPGGSETRPRNIAFNYIVRAA
ncbi:prophage tail fiber N-terminal domain-containing protein [Escherichia coli]|nr:prophage tail fiber N-terminal domain-containing protein [Escherichia coli]